MDDARKTCGKCGRDLPLTAFYPYLRQTAQAPCHRCCQAENERAKEDPAVFEQRRDRVRAFQQGLRDRAIDAYGAKCHCCGESTRQFLSIESLGAGVKGQELYKWLRDHKYPATGAQCLCRNCGEARRSYGYCPHRPEDKVTVTRGRPRLPKAA